MNVRSRKPAANGASARAPATETSRSRYIAISSARYGTTDEATSSSVSASLGFAYGATAAFHGARAPPTPCPCTAAPALIDPPSFGHRREARPARPVAIVATAQTLAMAKSAGVHAPFRNRRQGDAPRPAPENAPRARDDDALMVRLIKWPLSLPTALLHVDAGAGISRTSWRA